MLQLPSARACGQLPSNKTLQCQITAWSIKWPHKGLLTAHKLNRATVLNTGSVRSTQNDRAPTVLVSLQPIKSWPINSSRRWVNLLQVSSCAVNKPSSHTNDTDEIDNSSWWRWFWHWMATDVVRVCVCVCVCGVVSIKSCWTTVTATQYQQQHW